VKSQPLPAAAAAPQTMLEAAFPFELVSKVARRDRYSNDRTYAVHKWWARRPPAVIRAILLAAVLPPDTQESEFWRLFSEESTPLAGIVVGDPFMGGATTLVEASRLGADVSGVDVDPLAVRIARVELETLDRQAFEAEAEALLSHLREQHDALYPSPTGREPLHYFRLREASCSACGEPSLIYRNLWLARDRGLAGAVVRDHGGVVFCPLCQKLHYLAADRKVINCCGRRHHVDEGTYARARFQCPCCGELANNEQLQVGRRTSRLIAIEETVEGGYREIRSPSGADIDASSVVCSADRANSPLGQVDSGRPASYGFETVADLFHSRQRAVFNDAFDWVAARRVGDGLREALMLAVSNALGSNNALCGYATDYGRLSSAFSAVRAYSVPVLSVELNPLHRSAGRGTLAATLRRLKQSTADSVRRNAFEPAQGVVVPRNFSAASQGRFSVSCSSADRPLPTEFGKFDLVLTDPPYFDFIPYSDLSLLYRAWLAPESRTEDLGGAPIYPVGEDASSEFAGRLTGAFKRIRSALKSAAPMIFTFHSSHEEAWEAVGCALRRSGFRVNAVFPVWADGRGGSHGHSGNCEWDLVFVCRPSSATGTHLRASVKDWADRIGESELESSDRRNFELGLAMAKNLDS
jgi:adenine-specific DNA methylase